MYTSSSASSEGNNNNIAVTSIFAGEDKMQGAGRGDADMLKYCLENNKGVKDCMIKVLNSRDHGLSYVGIYLGNKDDDNAADESGRNKKKEVTYNCFLEKEFGGGMGTGANRDYNVNVVGMDAEVASLLSTAWMETYSRVFLDTTGIPVKGEEEDDETGYSWAEDI